MSYNQPTNNPYGQQSSGNGPYAQPTNPYGQPSATDPYAQPSASPYGQPSASTYGQTTSDPYATSSTNGATAAQPSSYGTSSSSTQQPFGDPYAQGTAGSPQQAANAYGQPAVDPYAGQNTYGAQPYGAQQTYGYGQSVPATGYAEPADPYAQKAYGAQQGYGTQQQYAQDPYAGAGYGQLQEYSGYTPGYAPNAYGAPRPDMGFGQAMKAFFSNYAVFQGRASKSEFMWPAIVYGALLAIGNGASFNDNSTLGGILGLVMIAMFLPMLGLFIRRFHDMNKSGWWTALNLIPGIGYLITFIMGITGASDPAGSRFDDPSGKQPKTGA